MREEVQDRYGNTIYLTDERWNHIIKGHCQLNGHRAEVLSTVRSGKRKQDPLLIRNAMLLSYDPEGDVLEVIFDESLHRAEQVAYKLRLGIVLYLTVDTMKPVQLTLVSYRGLAQFPVIHFDGWDKLSKSDKARLSPILQSPAISAFLRIDPKTGNGHIASPDMLDILPLAA